MGENLPMIRQDEALMPTTYEGIMKQAQTLVKSGVLPQEVKTPEAAVAIMLMGRELDIPPMQAFRSIYVVKGKPTLSAQLMGALILRAGHTYHVDELSEKGCAITFTRRGGLPYQHTFTIEEAKRAGLADSPTWRSYTKAMLFSRCMSAGARIAMPDVMAGMYTTEELSDPQMVTVDEVTGEVVASNAVIEGHVTEVEPEREQPAQQAARVARPRFADIPRPWEADVVTEALRAKAEKGATGPASEKQVVSVARNLEGLFSHDNPTSQDMKRRAVLRHVFGVDSAKQLTIGQASALIAWSNTGAPDYLPNDDAIVEAEAIVIAHDAERGQMMLGMEGGEEA